MNTQNQTEHRYLLCPDYNRESDYWPEEANSCGGWLITDLYTVHECPMHYNGQPNPLLNEELY